MKPLSEQGTNLGTYPAQIDAGKATAVRLYNSSSSDETVTFYEYDPMFCGHTVGSLTIPAGEVIYAQKKAEDFIKATSNSVNAQDERLIYLAFSDQAFSLQARAR